MRLTFRRSSRRVPTDPEAAIVLGSSRIAAAEFVWMMAAVSALSALGIDTVLPSLLLIGREFRVGNENALQWVVAGFVAGSGVGQILYGPLSDRFGRKPLLLVPLALYTLLLLASGKASEFGLLVALRVLQGFVIAAAYVVPKAILRDEFAGDPMARVMSIIFAVVLIVPALAPTLGQGLLLFISWRGIYVFLATASALVCIWLALRLRETLPPPRRRSLRARHLWDAARFVLRKPTSIFYTLAVTAMSGSFLAYLSTMPQIFARPFHSGRLMPLVFGLCAICMGAASLLSSQIVLRYGARRISHGALVAFIAVSLLHALISLQGLESIAMFTVLQGLTLASLVVASSNFGVIAMQPMAEFAGSAASIQGALSMFGGAAIGELIGQQWSGSVSFLPIGGVCCGLAALVFILIAEKGQLFALRGSQRSHQS